MASTLVRRSARQVGHRVAVLAVTQGCVMTAPFADATVATTQLRTLPFSSTSARTVLAYEHLWQPSAYAALQLRRHSSAQVLTDDGEAEAEEEQIAQEQHGVQHSAGAEAKQQETGAPVVPTLVAEVRSERDNGSRPSRRLRSSSRIPGVLFGEVKDSSRSQAKEDKVLLSFALKDMEKIFRLYGTEEFLLTQPFMLQVADPAATSQEPKTVRVLPRNVQRDSVTRKPLNINFMHCPPERRVKVKVPLRFVGVEGCLGLKRGGYLNRVMNTLDGYCRGDEIPPFIDVDISSLELHRSIRVSSLSIPDTFQFSKDRLDDVVVKVSGKAARDK